jgi:hypothetical protein
VLSSIELRRLPHYTGLFSFLCPYILPIDYHHCSSVLLLIALTMKSSRGMSFDSVNTDTDTTDGSESSSMHGLPTASDMMASTGYSSDDEKAVVTDDSSSSSSTDTLPPKKQSFWRRLLSQRSVVSSQAETTPPDDGAVYQLQRVTVPSSACGETQPQYHQYYTSTAGVYWRPNPGTRHARQQGTLPPFTAWRQHYPREGALLRGYLINVSTTGTTNSKKTNHSPTTPTKQTWLIVSHVQNPTTGVRGRRRRQSSSKWQPAPPGAALPWNMANEGYVLEYASL